MKKIFLLIVITLIIFSNNSSKDANTVFSIEKEEIYDNYIINFEECILNTNNFLEKFEYFKDTDFKILEIVPYNDLNNKYLFYTNDLEYINQKFKNDYINIMLENSKYTTNICIKEVKINASNYVLDKYKNVINFTY